MTTATTETEKQAEDVQALAVKISGTSPEAEVADDVEYPERCTDEVIEVANTLRADHHQDLAGMRVQYIWDKLAKSHGKVRLGQAKKLSARDQLLMDCEFVVIFNGQAWWDLGPEQRVALIDHELYHCTTDPDGEPDKRSHNLEEFNEIVVRHGLWRGTTPDHLQ